MSDTFPKTPIDQTQIGPVTVFDLHLRVLSESYIAFFQERIKIEEHYFESLSKVHAKWKALDSLYDERVPSTVRRAWREVRENLDREAETRRALAEGMRKDVLAPLVTLKETQDRTRKRIKEDLKASISAYNQFAENELPKCKRSYLRKCQEVEDLKATPPSPSCTNTPIDGTQGSSTRHSSQAITSPIPLRSPTRQPSVSHPTTRNRSPSGSTSLSELAHQGKKQLSQFMTFLDNKGNPLKEGLSGRTDNALRGVRAKREADEADKEYRKAVHWLETLRLNRIKILESGYKSVELFVYESTDRIKEALENYANCLMATCSTASQLTKHVTAAVSQISAEQDTLAVSSQTSRSMALATPRSTPYINFHVGECKDLLFGVSLVDYANARALSDGQIPRVVELCLSEVERRGLDTEGIYRISGRHANVHEICQRMERNEANFTFSMPSDDIFSVSSLLKLYLRELPEPLFRLPLQERMHYAETREEHISSDFRVLRAKIRRLPVVNQTTLRRLLNHLGKVAARCEKNKMDTKNLAIVFGAVVFGEDELTKTGDVLNIQGSKDIVMEDMISQGARLFEGDTLPPLPAAPRDEPQAIVDYGSSYTQIATLPPKGESGNAMSGDFTPLVPPRPDDSIHPSRRTKLASDDSTHLSMLSETGEQSDVKDPAVSEIGTNPDRPDDDASLTNVTDLANSN